MRRTTLLIGWIIFLLLQSSAAADKWERALLRGDKPLEDEREAVKQPNRREKPFKGYSSYFEDFQQICAELEKDGRRELIFHLVSGRTGKDVNCAACRPFFKTFTAACKEKRRNPKRKPVDPMAVTAVPEYTKPKQREPSPALVRKMQETFQAISLDYAIREETLGAVEVYAGLLRQQDGKLPGERDYCDMLAEFALQPFKELIEERDKHRKGSARAEPLPTTGIDDLFDK